MKLKFLRLVSASTLAISVLGTQANASQYIFDWESRSLTLNGEPTDKIDLHENGSLLFTISFSGGWLSGDNYFELSTVMRNDSRISFTLLPDLDIGSGLHIKTFFLDFTDPIPCADEYKVRDKSFDALIHYHDDRCGNEGPKVRTGGYFVSGSGVDDAASTYRIDISAVPVPAGLGLLSSAFALLGLSCLHKRRIK